MKNFIFLWLMTTFQQVLSCTKKRDVPYWWKFVNYKNTPILRQTMQDFVQSNMNNLLSCRCNMDTNRVEARFEDGTTLAIDCIAIEDEYGNTPGTAGRTGLAAVP